MKWRVIPLATYDAFMNMAIDEAIAESVAMGKVAPTIRFYQWKPSAVSIGYFQSLQQEVQQQRCAELGVDVVRRRTGGGAVYHDKELTYSVIAPESLLPKGITESYHTICGWVVNGLKNVGIVGEFKPINDIIVKGKKISGNAQTRRDAVVLQHGTILYDLNVETMFSLLKVSQEKISDKMIQSVKERVTSVLEHANVSELELYEAMRKGFTENKEWEFGDLSGGEMERARQLAEQRYRTKAWNEMR